MVDTSKFQTIAIQVEQRLIELDSIREEIIKLSRKVVRNSGQSIENFHNTNFEQSKEKLLVAKNSLSEVNNYLKKDATLQQIGIVGVAMQEYTEAKLLYELIINKKFLSFEEIGINEQSYILGIADLIGELRRYVLEKLVEGQIDDAKKFYEIMKKLYGSFLQIDYGKNLIPEFRRKKDTARVLVERTLSDLFVAVQGRKLEEKLKGE
ncbi:MAG: haloacid dehalogenase [Candidatus Heimdallarchaeota archaeon]|nr:haloacid dehalogenase [Candidatus Heimdallarchaeota archaeon]MCK4878106.1 haloacid dehalogenase [Candidatus Heimdallarchaeota archaeon]